MTKEEEEQKQLEDKLKIAYEVAESRFLTCWNALNSIDTKINAAFGFASVILGLIAGLSSIGSNKLPLLSLSLFALATIAYIVLVILSLIAYRVKRWSNRPDIKTMLDYCMSENIISIQEWLVNECKISFDINNKSIAKKGNLINYILALLGIETLLLTAGLIYSIL